MIDETPKATSIHSAYCRLAQADLTLTMDRLYYWNAWLSRGFTEADLRLVIRYLLHEVKAGRRFPGSLKWCNLIQNADRFEEDLALARGWERNNKPAPTDKDRVLQAARPVVGQPPAESTANHVGSIIPKLLEEMRKAAK